MKIKKFETWWVKRGKSIFDDKRKGKSPMDWDIVVLKLTTDNGIEGFATALAARSGKITETFLHENIAPFVMDQSPFDRERIWYELWNIDRHETFFPNYLPGPVDVALWDIAAKANNLPLYKYIGAYRNELPVYASGLFHTEVEEYFKEANYYKEKGIQCYKAHPAGPFDVDMIINEGLREAVGDEFNLITDPVGEYTYGEAIKMGRQLENLNFLWFEEPFRDFEMEKYARLCAMLDIPVASTETTRGCHWGVAQSIVRRATDIVRADVSWKWGITGTLKIAHLADSFGLQCEIHTTMMHFMDVVNLHVSCSIRNCKYFEYFVPESTFNFLMKERLQINDSGIITVPNSPGIGVNLDWDIIDNNCVSYKKFE